MADMNTNNKQEQSTHWLRGLERCLWAAACVCLVPVALVEAGRAWAQQTTQPIKPSATSITQPATSITQPVNRSVTQSVNTSAWSAGRIAALQKFQLQAIDGLIPPAIGSLSLEVNDERVTVPIFTGTSEFAMTLGAGHLTDTAGLEGTGNIALSSHRDGVFRALKDVRLGDRLTLTTSTGELRTFQIRQFDIVAPEDTRVLGATEVSMLTLITCYPFYFVGSAPLRYIVQAVEV